KGVSRMPLRLMNALLVTLWLGCSGSPENVRVDAAPSDDASVQEPPPHATIAQCLAGELGDATRWVRCAGGPGGYAVPRHAAGGPSGELVVVGTAHLAPSFGSQELVVSGESDGFIARYDAQGQLSWVRAVGGTAGATGAGDDAEVVEQVAVGADGSITVGGHYVGPADLGNGCTLPGPPPLALRKSDVFVARYDASGQCQWATRIGEDDAHERLDSLHVDGQ